MPTPLQNTQANERLIAKSRAYANTAEIRKADGTVRHKCFLSYHHDDAVAVEEFVTNFEDVFIPKVIGISDQYGELVDSYDDDYVMDRIREDFLTDSTVTIVFIGACTSTRKFIDWEIYSTLRNDSNNRRSGLMAIQLPTAASLPARLGLNYTQGDEDSYARYWVYPSTGSVLQGWIQDAFDARTTRAAAVKLGGARQSSNYACTA